MHYHEETRQLRPIVKWTKDMTIRTRQFRTIDIIAALTSISLDRSCSSEVNELAHYVTGIRPMPRKGSRARRSIVTAVRSQLPCGINKFGVSDLIKLVMQLNKGQQEDELKASVIQILEERFGPRLTLSPEQYLETSFSSLSLLRSIAEHPDATANLE